MVSNIDPTKPDGPIAYTADVRGNFAIAQEEISQLQQTLSQPPQAAQIVISQTVVTLTPGADVIVAPARPRSYLAIMNIDRSDATLNFDKASVAGSGWILTAAYVSGAQGGGMTWGSGEGVPVNAVHAISTAGTRLVVLEGF